MLFVNSSMRGNHRVKKKGGSCLRELSFLDHTNKRLIGRNWGRPSRKAKHEGPLCCWVEFLYSALAKYEVGGISEESR